MLIVRRILLALGRWQFGNSFVLRSLYATPLSNPRQLEAGVTDKHPGLLRL
jgi:hypothetical protein